MANFKDPKDNNYQDLMKDFEKSRIEKLQEERENVQQKTFTKWCNSFLSKHGMEINNLFRDLEDGKRLIKLLECISNKKLGKPNQGRMRVHKIENVNMALTFIQSQLHAIGAKLESIGAEDIVDGNRTLILGLVWTIILRFQISEITTPDDEPPAPDGKLKNSKEILLLWCQRRTANYPGVRIVDFTHSWRDGRAFNALINSQRPDLFDYNRILQLDNLTNLEHAFEQAERYYGIAKILDAEDIDVDKPDEKLILTYVATIYHAFAKLKTEVVGGKRIGKVVAYLQEIDRNKEQYEQQMAELMSWITRKEIELGDHQFPNSLDGIKKLMLTFNKGYMALEKPPKYKEKGMLEANFYNINMKLSAQGHPKYVPPEGKTINDLEMCWSALERAEHERDLALKKELNRQEQLEQMYENFDKKAKLREDWLNEMSNILSSSIMQQAATSQIDATFRKHEAIGADINARSERFNRLDELAKVLVDEDYFFKDTVKKRNQQIQIAYMNLLSQFEKRKATLASFQELALLFQEMESLKNEMLDLEKSFQSKEYGDYLLAVEDLITKHSLLESQIAGINQHLKSVNRRAQQFIRQEAATASTNSPVSVGGVLQPSSTSSSLSNLSSPASTSHSSTPPESLSPSGGDSRASSTVVLSEGQLVREKVDALNKAFDLITVLGAERRKYLEERRDYHKFLEEADEELMWISEKNQILKSSESATGHDLGSTQILINKHEQLEDEIKFRVTRIDKLLGQGSQLKTATNTKPGSSTPTYRFSTQEQAKIVAKCQMLAGRFGELKEAATQRRALLEDSYTSQQYHVDANEAESWVKDKLALVSLSSDSGRDEAQAQAALKRHVRVQEEIKAYEPEMKRLQDISDILIGKRRFSSIPADMKQQVMRAQKRNALVSTGVSLISDTDEIETDETDNETDVSSSVSEDYVEREFRETYTEEVRCVCVKALYPYQAKTMSMNRGEVLELKERSTPEWWLVEKNSGIEAYVPATYLKEIGMQSVIKQRERIVKKPELVRRTSNRKSQQQQQHQPIIKARGTLNSSIVRRKTTSIKPRQLQHLSTESLKERQVEINYLYNQLLNLSIERRKQLDNTIGFFRWSRKHDELSKWVREKQAQISNKSNSVLENPDATKRVYQAFIGDYLANQAEYVECERLAKELVAKKLSFPVDGVQVTSESIARRQEELSREWLKLAELKKYWDESIKAIQCIDQFNSLCAEVDDLIKEKLQALENSDISNETTCDVRTVRALQSKQDKLEREIGPLEKNCADLHRLADEVCRYFPQDKASVARKCQHIDAQWAKLKESVRLRKLKLDEKHGLQRFENEWNDVAKACSKVRLALAEIDAPQDLKSGEEMEKRLSEIEHDSIKNEIDFKIDDLGKLGQTLINKKGTAAENANKIVSSLEQINGEKLELAQLVVEKRHYLDDYLKYLKFKQDATNFELIMQDQEAYLQFDDVGSSASNVDALQKRHDEFVAKMNAQDEKLKLLEDQLKRLTGPKRTEMDSVYAALVERRKRLKSAANERKVKLAQSKEFFEFKIECDDLEAWISERRRFLEQIKTESTEIERVVTKHETVEKELIANRTRLDKLVATGEDLLSRRVKSVETRELVERIKKNWADLERQTAYNGEKLAEAKLKADLTKSLNDVEARMRNLTKEVAQTYQTNDLRSVKDALKKHQDLKNQLRVELDLVDDLSRAEAQQLGSRPSSSGSTTGAIAEYADKFAALTPLLEQKQKELENALVLKQLLFDLDEQLKWIEQTSRQLDMLTSKAPQTLFDATNIHKKVCELERSLLNNHKPNVDKILNQSKLHLSSSMQQPIEDEEELANKTELLETEWLRLLKDVEMKKFIAAKALSEQQCLDELNQIMAGLSEKWLIIDNADVIQSQDETLLNKHMAKLNQLKDELKGYNDILNKINKEQVSKLKSTSTQVEPKYQQCRGELSTMEEQIEEKKLAVKCQLEALEFGRETAELIQWMTEKRTQAQSEDYGQDLEHLNLIKAKFTQLKDEVRSSEPKYQRLKRLGQDLLTSRVGESKPIRKRLDDLKSTREQLEAELAQRELILDSAAEIHRFNKDVHDLLRCIAEKEAAFVSDLGRDSNTCELLQRKHQIYIEELQALKNQLAELNKQSELLRQRHPGDTAECVAAEMDELIDRFKALWLMSERRTRELKQASDYFRFISCIRDVSEWMLDTHRSLTQPVQFSDLFSVSQAKQEHDNLSFEMSQRDDLFKSLEEMCLQLTGGSSSSSPSSPTSTELTTQHPNKKDIIMRTNAAMIERENLFRLWDLKNKLLDSQYDCHEFYRDANQVLGTISSMEVMVAKAYHELDANLALDEPRAISVDDLESLAKTNENLKKKLDKQSHEKVVELQKKAALLIECERARLDVMESHHRQIFNLNEIGRLEESLFQVLKRENDLNEMSLKRTRQLNDALKFFRLKRDVDEFLAWIDERIRYAQTLSIRSEAAITSSSFNDQVKLFQRQKALNVEIEANSARYADLNKRCKEEIVANKTLRPVYMRRVADELTRAWQQLAFEAAERAKEFDEAKDLLEFNDQLEQLELWLKDKELMIQNGDTGRDYEHCVSLMKRADEAISPIYEEKLHSVLAMGDKLAHGRTGAELDDLIQKKKRILTRFEQVKAGVEEYKISLKYALEMHQFMRDYDDLDHRIKEKIKLLGSDPDPKTLDAVQVAQSKLLDLEHDMTAIGTRLAQQKREAAQLIAANERRMNGANATNNEDLELKNNLVRMAMKDLEANWAQLSALVEARKLKLASIGDFQRFLVEHKDLLSWMQDMQARMSAQAEPVSLSEAELALNLHAERRTEIDGKTHRFIALRQMATQLAPEYQQESSRLMRELLDAEQALQLKAAEKAKFLQDAHEYQSLREHWKQVENWLKSVEAGLKSKECGDSVLGVEALLAKHKNVESSIRSQLAPGAAFDALEQRAKEMIKQGHSKSSLIQVILEDVHAGKRDLEQLANARRQLLEHSLMYQNFLLNYYDCVQWIKEKTATAMDKNYADLTNLQTKIQRHATFTSDLKKSGQKRVDDIHNEADALRPRSDLDEMLSDLDSQWLALKQATDIKRKRLDDAYKCVHFTRQCDDLSAWFDEAELELGSDDQGRDLASCKLLLLRHETLVKQIESQREKLADLEGQLAASKENFMFAKMQEAFNAVKQRYLNLTEPCSIRHDNLDESLRLFEVCHELDDLTQWTQERLSHVGSVEQIHVTSLDETKKLLNKHEQLCAELKQQQPVYVSLQKTTKQLIDRKHFSHALLATKLSDLEQKWTRLADLVDQKSVRLEQVLEMQVYFAEVDEFNEWLKEKQVDLLSPDYGKTDSTVLTNLKKCQALSADLKQNKQTKLNQLGEKSAQLQSNTSREAADRKTIARKQSDLESLYTRVLEVAVEREQALSTMLRIFEFERECEATQMWMRDQTVVAASQDFGADLEHADALLKKFLEFMGELERNADRVNRLDEMAQLLCENKYTPKQWIELIDERCGEMNRAWQELNTLAEVRRQTLEGAIEVHAFDKDCDDLIAWAQEKENLISDRATSNSDHLLGYDVASFYTLSKQQESLESELDTLHDELERLSQESARLCAQYPETRDHIETRLEDAQTQYESLLRELKHRNERIQWAREWFSFASEFHELSEWFRDMLARVTAQQDLNTIATGSGGGGNEVNSAEMLVKRHRELKIEIDLQHSRVIKFGQKADELAARKKTSHAMQQEIKSKKESCNSSWRNLNETWTSRQDLYEHNLEYNKLAREIKLLDAWLSSKDSYVHTDLLGDTIASVEAQLKQHEDFESMLKAMEARFEALKRENKLEKTLRELKERENAQRVQADKQLEEERRKDAERRRKLELRRQDERRRTQEIIANISSDPTPGPTTSGLMDASHSEAATIAGDVSQPSGEVTLKRAPSGLKKDRNRTRSIRDKYKLPLRLPQPSIGDYLRRKQEFQKGGQRAPIREYQAFYTTIHANLMCFFVDKRDYNELNAAAQPITLFECRLSRLEEPTLQRDVIHVETSDGAEYLFDAAGDDDNRELFDLWYNKIAEASAIPSLSVLSVPSTSTISTSSMSNTTMLNTSQSATSLGPEPNTTTTTISPDHSQTNVSSLKPRSRAPLMVVSQLPTINSVSAIEVEKQPANNSTTTNNSIAAYDLSIASFSLKKNSTANFLFFDHHCNGDEGETTTSFLAVSNANTTNSPTSSTNPNNTNPTTSKSTERLSQEITSSPSSSSASSTPVKHPYHEPIKLDSVQHPASSTYSSSSSVSPQTSSNASDNVGHLDSVENRSPAKPSQPPPLPPRGSEERRPVSIIKTKPPIYSSLSPRTSGSQLSPKSPTTVVSIQQQSSTESSISEIMKPPNTPTSTTADLRQMSYNIAVNSEKKTSNTSPPIDDYRTRITSSQTTTEVVYDSADYNVRNIVLSDPKKSTTLPIETMSNSESSNYTSIKTAKEVPTKETSEKKHKKNIFNSLFKSKAKYEVKAQSTAEEDSIHGSPTSSKKKNK